MSKETHDGAAAEASGLALSGTREDFVTLSDAMFAFAKHSLDTDGELEPMIAVMDPPSNDDADAATKKMRIGLMPVGMIQDGTMGKDIIAHLLMRLAQTPGVRVAGYMSEAWMSRPENRDAISAVPPSEDPNRMECVIFSLMSADCQALRVCTLDRSSGEPVLSESDLQFDGEAGMALQGRFMRPRAPLH